MNSPVEIRVRNEGASEPGVGIAATAGLSASGNDDWLAALYRSRGANPDERGMGLAQLLRPSGLPDIDKAAARIALAVTNQERIVVVGDFDADGATSVALSMLVLRAFGALEPQFLVPNRFEYGYGLSPEIVALAQTLDPQLLITVDNGVSSIAGVERANGAGMDVIVTDHHLPGAELPAALALVNPVLADSEFGSKALAGVGVIYYVLSATRRVLAEQGWFNDLRPSPNLASFLDLVALGTVADVVPLDCNNRILVQQGLLRMRAGHCRPGIKAMLEFAGRDLHRLVAADLGFALGPRLNAAGRLDDMSIGIRCLLADDMAQARRLAKALDELNRVRRELEAEMVAEAQLHAAKALSAVSQTEQPRGIALYDELWHQGVVGLVAGRLKDKLNRPVIAFAEAGDAAPGELKGSARSIPGLHIRDVLDEIAASNPGLIQKFGGHAMAAGLTISRIHFKQFARIFETTVSAHLSEDALRTVYVTDGELPVDALALELAVALRNGGPWGQGFPEPSFHGHFRIVSQRTVGDAHLKLTLQSGEKLLDAIAFRTPPVDAEQVRVVYRLDENSYRDRRTLQLMVEHIAPLG